MQRSLRRQRGLSFVSVVLIGAALVAAFAIGGQSVPIFTEHMAVKKAVQKAASEAASVAELRAAFDRSASIDNIQSLSGMDLEIGKQGERFTVSYAYEREISLVGPAYLVYRFKGSTQ
ncbi:DUF4845 domain-containing protein [Comamonas nitrativorans]|uniref:DUF4845 domain-containing protein n=1 Tax=Comamonas nitrativorans TaxID=108437 RepID=A0ABV9GUK2_9BURK|nr:DUF4845 domain-containing protein [Comamonas sp.]